MEIVEMKSEWNFNLQSTLDIVNLDIANLDIANLDIVNLDKVQNAI